MDYLLKASAVIALFYLCFYFFLKKETFFNHNRWFLLIGVVIALIFPFVVIPIQITVEPELIPETIFAISKNIPVNIQKPIPEPKFEWQTLLPIIYGIGLTVFLVQFLFQFGSLILLLMKNPKNKDGMYTYVIVNNTISPFSFFKWIVYNPESFNAKELRLMLTHEKVHANQLHSIDILLLQLACSIFWFNPLMWFYRKEVRQNLEYIADYKTQEKSNSEIEYQHLLLKTSVTNHNISLSNNFYNSLIKERIVMLKKSRSSARKQWRYLLMLPLLAGLLMSMNTEKVYIETESSAVKNDDTIKFVVTKNTTDAELKAMSTAVENKAGTLVFSQITRNKTNELTNIFLKLNNHSYGGTGDYNPPIDTFLIYKEFFGFGGGYVGSNGMGTMHFDDHENGNNPKVIKAFKMRTNKVLLKNQLTTLNLNHKTIDVKESIKIIFSKKTTDKQLEDIKKELKSQGVTMTIKRLKRNDKNEIVDINLDFETKNGSANYNVKDKDGIKAFYFNMEDNGSFGVGAINNNMHVIETIHESLPEKSHSKSKSNVFILKDNDSLELIVEDSLNPKILNRYRKVINKLNNAKKNDSIYFRTIDSVEVKRLSNVKSDFYYEGDAPIKIIKTGENIILHQSNDNSHHNRSYSTNEKAKPLIIVDRKEVSNAAMKFLNPKDIDRMNVLKGDSATEIYGEKGENGVIVITTKGKNTWTTKSDTKEKNPWSISLSTSFIDEDDTSKNGTLVYISKRSADHILEAQKTIIEKQGIKVKYSKVRRNKAGEITSIKISLKNENGNESSASYKNDDGISPIEFGITEGALVVRTSKMPMD